MNVHFLKPGSLELLKLNNYFRIPDVYKYINIQASFKFNCEVLGFPIHFNI